MKEINNSYIVQFNTRDECDFIFIHIPAIICQLKEIKPNKNKTMIIDRINSLFLVESEEKVILQKKIKKL